jgi:enolase
VENSTSIKRVTAKKVFKNSKIQVRIATLTNNGIGYDVIDVENPDFAISDVENILAPELVGYPAYDQDIIDSIICDTSVDNTKVTMGTSISIARAAANSVDIPLFKHIGGVLSSNLPVVGCSLVSDGSNQLLAIPMAESIGEMIHIYNTILSELSKEYSFKNNYGEYISKNVFNDIEKFKEIISNVSDEEDVEILAGAKILEYGANIEEIDYLESHEIIDFDGILCTENIDEEADFSKFNPYQMGTLTEMSYYVNYISEKGLNTVIEGDNTSFPHIAIGFKIPFLRASINSKVLNELWNIERILNNPNITRF